MKKISLLTMIMLAMIFFACKKQFEKDAEQKVGNHYRVTASIAASSKRSAVFFASKQEAADKVIGFAGLQLQTLRADNITNILYIQSMDKVYSLVYYETAEGPKNIVIIRSYSASGDLQKESASTCNGATCNCKIQATIDNQGNVTVGCSCSSCTLVSSY